MARTFRLERKEHIVRPDTVCQLFRRCLEDRREEDWSLFLERFGEPLRFAVRQEWTWRRGGPNGFGLTFEETVQEFYCHLLTHGHGGFRGGTDDELWQWMRQVAAHMICDLWRRRRARKRNPKEGQTRLVRVGGTGVEPMTWLTPEDRLLIREGLSAWLRRCRAILHELSSETVVAMMRRAFFEGYTSQEIAEASEGRLTTADVDRLLRRLRTRLAEQGLVLPRRGGAGQQVACPQAACPQAAWSPSPAGCVVG